MTGPCITVCGMEGRGALVSALDALSVFTIGAGPDEIALKQRLLKAQAIASTRAARETNLIAAHAYWLADQFARDWLPRRSCKCEDLEEALKGLSWLFLFAGVSVRLEALDGD